MKKSILLIIAVTFLSINSIQAQSRWISLFNGEDLTGWTARGKATWAVKDGVLIGEGDNGHIYAAPELTDLEVKGKFRVTSTGKNANSGFYFRANPPLGNPDGYPRGYEAQIDNKSDAHTGWLWKPGTPTGKASANPTKDGEWFDYRIKAIGSRIEIWINDESVMVHYDNEYKKGYFAIQVHNPGMKIEAKDLYYKDLSKSGENGLSKREKEEGWELLFNGNNFNGWRKYNETQMPANWVIEDDGSMKVFPGEKGSSGDIIYGVKKFGNFELSVDFKAGPKANSGIFYNIREVPGMGIGDAAPEVQVLDNEEASDNKTDSHLAGSLYDMIPADPKTVNPAGFWNTVVLRVENGKVTHTMNGNKVVEYTLWSPEWDELVQNSKFKTWPGFIEGISKEGYIGLQDHGNTLWFRNIKIREL